MEGELVPELSYLSLVDRPLELTPVQEGGQVEEGAGDGRDGDAVLDGDLVIRNGHDMEANSLRARR